MRVVSDTDILSTFARIGRLDIMDELFEEIMLPPSVRSELANGRIDLKSLKPTLAKLTGEELKALKLADPRLGRGEKECLVVAKGRGILLASNDRVVCLLCRREDIEFLTLPMILRLSITEDVVTRQEARQLVKLIENEEHTVIRDKDSIFG